MSESEILDIKPDCSEEPDSTHGESKEDEDDGILNEEEGIIKDEDGIIKDEEEEGMLKENERMIKEEDDEGMIKEDDEGMLKDDDDDEGMLKDDDEGMIKDDDEGMIKEEDEGLIKEEDDGISSSGECDSPEPVLKDEDEKIPEQIISKKENCTLLRPMDGELDYEDEVDEDKEKKAFDLDQKVAEPEKKEDNELDEDDDQKKDKAAPDAEAKDKNDAEKEDSMEEGEDEGEISDDDLEEGEVKDASPKPETTRQVCRFYGRGQCFYGNACRFLHLNHNEKGQYNMFAPRYSQGYAYGPANLMGPSNSMMAERPSPRMDYMAAAPPPAPLLMEPSPVETAWERGLREAKELVKKANKRKEEEPDFDKKKLNLSLNVNERNSPEYDKENEFYYSRSYSKRNEGHYKKSNARYEEPCEFFENDRTARENFRSGRFENFEVRYTREDVPRERRGRERSRGRMSTERERYTAKEGRNKDRLKDDRMFDVQMRARAFDYVDPWRRSKTPKARRTHSRSGSYSSVSSYSYSDRSSRSSGSYSRSSSRSSASSRSPSVMHKRKPSPVAETAASPKGGVGRFPLIKKKPAGRPNARSSSSRSRSPSRTPSVSRSRSYSRSISMDSVSSASSSVSHSSSGSGPRRNRGHGSLLRKNDEKLSLDKLDSRNISYDREDGDAHEDMYGAEANVDSAFPSFQHLLPNDSKGKSQHKQQIKLTLLSKNASSKATSFPKKELDRSKLLGDQKSDSSKQDLPSYTSGTKRPLSPTLSATNAKSNATAPKKSASSRRDELLKQLKAVEDAIARKRAKFC